MSTASINDIERLINQKYARGEAWFKAGDMRRAVEDLYTEDLYYLKTDLTLVRGREDLIVYFESIKSVIAEVHVQPVVTWGDPSRVIYQLCNTERRAPGSGEISRAHYIAAFRRINEDWLCEMEVPALGRIDFAS